LDGDVGAQIAEVGGAQVLEFSGPKVGTDYGSKDLPRHVWIIVQDSSMGVVFTEPSGLKLRNDIRALDADLVLVALDPIMAVRLYMFVFDIWGENRVLYEYDAILHRSPGIKFDFNPWFRVYGGIPYGCVTWVGRVRLRNGTVRKSDNAAAVIGIQKGILDTFTEEELEEFLKEPRPTGDRDEQETKQA